jgi:hypothetical protein
VHIVGLIFGLAIIGIVLLDAFETILQPRRVTHKFRLARFYYRENWQLWSAIARLIPAGKRREAMLSFFGPLSLLGLFVCWVAGLVLGFALVNWGAGEQLITAGGEDNFFEYVYMSGTTFFTLGYGDVTPTGYVGRVMAMGEAGLGFAFLAVIISYLPGITQAFSNREVTISLLDARAGSPPSAAQFLFRLARGGSMGDLNAVLAEWEQWSAAVLESHLSFPVLGFFRSQHDNQSWLAAITFMLDTCAIIMTELKDVNPYRAQLTFAMARHAVVDLSLIFRTGVPHPAADRLPSEKRLELHAMLREAGLDVRDDAEGERKLTELRATYEPFITGLAQRFMLSLPSIVVSGEVVDNWQRSPGMRAPGLEKLPVAEGVEDHFGV